jgi:twitching motility protein PilT
MTNKEATSIVPLLETVAEKGGSDLHLIVGRKPFLRLHGKLLEFEGAAVLSDKQVKDLIYGTLSAEKQKEIETERELDYAYEIPSGERFRVNIHWQKGGLGLAARLIPKKIPTPDDLGLTPEMQKLLTLPNGLILVTGPTGCGKSTTLAAMINQINLTSAKNIITLEDPIEFVYPVAESIVRQREVGSDSLNFAAGLKHMLRQDPNIILVGEMRDLETISTTLTLAETGHLVFATLHTNNAATTVQRIVDVFPEFQQMQIKIQLAMTLRAVISQQLFPLPKGGRIAAREFLINTPASANLIRENKPEQIGNVIQTASKLGMFTLEQDIKRLMAKGLIAKEDAARFGVVKK